MTRRGACKSRGMASRVEDAGGLLPGLHVVATPIGAARDITLRALDVLRAADVLAAEDTRTARKLLQIHGVALNGRPLLPYHDHNGPAQRPKILALLEAGKSVAYVSDAGTPLVADPGFVLARAAIEAGHRIHAAPGPSAVLAALVVSGLPSDRFLFAGFLPPRRARATAFCGNCAACRRRWCCSRRRAVARTACVRWPRCWAAIGGRRSAANSQNGLKRCGAALCPSLAQGVADDPPRGEVVLVIDRGTREADSARTRGALLAEAMRTMSCEGRGPSRRRGAVAAPAARSIRRRWRWSR